MATTLQSRVADVIDYVVKTMRATPGYRAPSDTTVGIPVFDGPELYFHEDGTVQSYLVIGYADDDGGSAVSESEFAQGPMGPQHSRDETVTITCCACGYVGDASDGSVSTVRRIALNIMADVANLCRANPSLGLDVSGVVGGVLTRAFVTAGTMTVYPNNGAVCDWMFTITAVARV